MKKILLSAILAFAFGCKTQNSTTVKTESKNEISRLSKTSDGDLLGQGNVKDLFGEPFRAGFSAGYDSYKPDVETVSKLRDLTNGISVKIFMGTWCEDSQNQVPKCYKILHDAGFDKNDVTLIFVDRSKTTPEKLEAGLNITNVPTFIFNKTTQLAGKEGPRGETIAKELNRIVESPRETLEKDMLKILSNQPYKHTYAD
ncbi:MAG: thioredoxin [Flavobacterium sp.]|uniref:thioredoxin n=1 Tax=Flavobacterium sp. TaxID=239 RepID=UPI00120C5845|nr:thioredoxin [Flavobacterium sp.]RZJ67222.1 MAG: thioredoxin [Flavobacterium sp.]